MMSPVSEEQSLLLSDTQSSWPIPIAPASYLPPWILKGLWCWSWSSWVLHWSIGGLLIHWPSVTLSWYQSDHEKKRCPHLTPTWSHWQREVKSWQTDKQIVHILYYWWSWWKETTSEVQQQEKKTVEQILPGCGGHWKWRAKQEDWMSLWQ